MTKCVKGSGLVAANDTFIYYWRVGRQIIGNGTFNLGTTTAGAEIAKSLPTPMLGTTEPFNYVRTCIQKIGANSSAQVEAHIDASGRLTISGAAPSAGWYLVSFNYVTAN